VNISIIGCGYVGVITGVCLANSGHRIFFFDKEKKKLENLKNGKELIYEKDLEYKFNKAKKNIFFCNSFEELVKKTDVAFVCVGTPLKKNNINLGYIDEVTFQLSNILEQKKKFTIIYKSTIPPLTVEQRCIPILKKKLGNKIDKNFNIIFNPEFLREGNAIQDFENPIRIILGIRNNKSKNILRIVYKDYIKKAKLIFVNIKTAEFIKYFSNAFFSLLISYSNEISNLCYKLGIDFASVLDAFKLDSRISIGKNYPELFNYLNPGIGYGGSCFPKDIKTFIKFSEKNNFNLSILKKVDKINSLQPKFISKIILKKFKEKKIKNCLVLGLTFKENTDDIRNSTSIEIVNILANSKTSIFVYDPIFSQRHFKKNKNIFNHKVKYFNCINVNKNFDFIVVNNSSKEYKKIISYFDRKYKSFIFDSRGAFASRKYKNYFRPSLNC
jgi:UDPglucose 6-dehydrogenase